MAVSTQNQRSSIYGLRIPSVRRQLPQPNNDIGAADRPYLLHLFHRSVEAAGYNDDLAAYLNLRSGLVRILPEADGTISANDRIHLLGRSRKISTGDTSSTLTGLVSTAQIGIATVLGDVDAALVGQFATGQIGTIALEGNALFSPPGVQNSTVVGNLSVHITHASKWWDQYWYSNTWWNDSWWNKATTVNEILTGQVSYPQIGSLIIQSTLPGDAWYNGAYYYNGPHYYNHEQYELTGLEATAQLGAISIAAETNIYQNLEGLASTTGLGTLTVTGIASSALTGQAATSQIGTLTVVTSTIVADGVSATPAVGSLSVIINISASITGVFADALYGNISQFTGFQIETKPSRVFYIEEQPRFVNINNQIRYVAIEDRDRDIIVID